MSSPKTKSPTGPSSPASGPKSTPSPHNELIPAADNDDVRFCGIFCATRYANLLKRMFKTTPTQRLKQTRKIYSCRHDQSILTIFYSESSTASVSSSILHYRSIQGRTFHSDKFVTEYSFPNDEQQLESVDIR